MSANKPEDDNEEDPAIIQAWENLAVAERLQEEHAEQRRLERAVGDPLKSKLLFFLLGHFPFPFDLIIFSPGKPKNSRKAEQPHKNCHKNVQ